MKAKSFCAILMVLLINALSLNAQVYSNSVVVSNYYDDYDFYFSSRINRFHKSYAVFEYYSPVYTDTYWYSYQPYSWGMSIYGGVLAKGYSEVYPVYNYPVYNYARYDPYYGVSYYSGYNPYYSYYWYSPVSVSFAWYGSPHHHYGYTGTRNVYNTYNTNYYYSSQRRYDPSAYARRPGVNTSRRTDASSVNDRTHSDNALHRGEIRRNPDRGTARGQDNSNVNNRPRKDDNGKIGNRGNTRNSQEQFSGKRSNSAKERRSYSGEKGSSGSRNPGISESRSSSNERRMNRR